jgi:hypothetical protein
MTIKYQYINILTDLAKVEKFYIGSDIKQKSQTNIELARLY